MWIADELANDLINRTLIKVRISSKYNFKNNIVEDYPKYKEEVNKALYEYEINKLIKDGNNE